MTTQLAPTWVPEGFQVLDGEPLGLIVMAQDYTPSFTEDFTDDLAGDAASGVAEMTATGAATRNATSWTLNLDDLTDTDTSGVTEVDGVATSGVWLYRLSDNKLIGFSSDPQPAQDPYAPTFPDGFYDLPIGSIDAILAGLRTDVDAALAGGGGGAVETPAEFPLGGTYYADRGRVFLDGVGRIDITTTVTAGDVIDFDTLPADYRPGTYVSAGLPMWHFPDSGPGTFHLVDVYIDDGTGLVQVTTSPVTATDGIFQLFFNGLSFLLPEA